MKSLSITAALVISSLAANAQAEISTFEQRVAVDGVLLDYPRFSATFTNHPFVPYELRQRSIVPISAFLKLNAALWRA